MQKFYQSWYYEIGPILYIKSIIKSLQLLCTEVGSLLCTFYFRLINNYSPTMTRTTQYSEGWPDNNTTYAGVYPSAMHYVSVWGPHRIVFTLSFFFTAANHRTVAFIISICVSVCPCMLSSFLILLLIYLDCISGRHRKIMG